jgi:sugar-phosphatase
MSELRVDAILFDMDGVLVDSGDVYDRHWRRWAAERDVDFAEVAIVHPGRPPRETIRLVAPHLDAADEAERYVAGLHGSDDSTPAGSMPGARELVAGLPRDRWAIATSAPARMAPAWLRGAGIPEPGALVTADDVEFGKPAPDPYLRAAELLGVEPSRCLVIEDAPAGIAAAKSAGATVLGVATTHVVTDLAEADHVTMSVLDVRAAMDGEQLVVSWQPTRS